MIALGTLIAYTHQAAVVRKAGKDQYASTGEWFLPAKGNGSLPGGLMQSASFKEPDGAYRFVDNVGKELSAESIGKFNKAIIAWEQPGSGVVTGLVTKQMGVSEAGYTSGGYPGGEPEYQEGYFVNCGQIQLYTVRHELRGTKFIYVPLWAAVPHSVQVAA